jgi:segregation and condensation protein A
MADPAGDDPGINPSGNTQKDPELTDSGELPPEYPGAAQGESSPFSGSESSVLPHPDTIEDPVEILVGLAERGEIDPWNIDIIEVTDRFLYELERCRQLNLQVSGRTLFYAATLLRMKSEHLELLSDPDDGDVAGDDELSGEDFDVPLDSEIDYQGRLGPIERLEHEIQRRLDRKNMRKSPVTLFELIIELKNIEKEERRRRRLTDTIDDFLIYTDDVVGIAHDEGYQESSMVRLAEYLEGLEIDEEMTLAELCEKMEWRIPDVYIPLLFLALDGRCSLRQEEFFGDVYVQFCRADN